MPTHTYVDQLLMEKLMQTTLQQPKPTPPGRLHSFLKDFVDPVPPHPPSLQSFMTEWLDSVGSDREELCRSDSYLPHADNLISRQLTRSAPVMGHTRDADGFVVPPTPLLPGPGHTEQMRMPDLSRRRTSLMPRLAQVDRLKGALLRIHLTGVGTWL